MERSTYIVCAVWLLRIVKKSAVNHVKHLRNDDAEKKDEQTQSVDS